MKESSNSRATTLVIKRVPPNPPLLLYWHQFLSRRCCWRENKRKKKPIIDILSYISPPSSIYYIDAKLHYTHTLPRHNFFLSVVCYIKPKGERGDSLYNIGKVYISCVIIVIIIHCCLRNIYIKSWWKRVIWRWRNFSYNIYERAKELLWWELRERERTKRAGENNKRIYKKKNKKKRGLFAGCARGALIAWIPIRV